MDVQDLERWRLHQEDVPVGRQVGNKEPFQVEQRLVYRTEITGTEAECTETENFGAMTGVHLQITETSPVNSGLLPGYPNRPKPE